MGGCAGDGSGRERSGAAGAEDESGREWRAGEREGRGPEDEQRDAADGCLDAESREAEARTERTSRVSRLHAEITAATREFLRAVLECDRHRDWEAAGFGSCAEWLGWLLGIQRNAANERVRVAKALEQLPLTSESMAHGEISFTKECASYCTSLR